MIKNFIDQITIQVAAGTGGQGVISFQRGRGKTTGKPDGGHGGYGGDVFLVADRSYHDLSHNKNKLYKAGDGEQGGKHNKTGKRGADLFIPVPLNTEVSLLPDNYSLGVLKNEGDILKVASGGKFGLGNAGCLEPKDILLKRKLGLLGDHVSLYLSTSLVADVCFIGLPNSGKSSLVSIISKSKCRVAAYPFTTLFPSVGQVEVDYANSFTVMDMPSIMAGSSRGHGLGFEFLKHAKDCFLLIYVLDLAIDDIAVFNKGLAICEHEVAKYDKNLLKKKRLVLLNKADINKDYDQYRISFLASNALNDDEVLITSCASHKNIDKLISRIQAFLEKA